MQIVALPAVKTPDPVPLVSPAQQSRYETALAAAAALEALFPLSPAEYAQAAGVDAILKASRR